MLSQLATTGETGLGPNVKKYANNLTKFILLAMLTMQDSRFYTCLSQVASKPKSMAERKPERGSRVPCLSLSHQSSLMADG